MRGSGSGTGDSVAAVGGRRVLALDPGRNLGAAWVRFDGTVERLAILTDAELERLALPAGTTVVVGDGTGSAALVERLRTRGAEPVLVDERDTSLRARALYFRDHPARGLARLLPPGMRPAPRRIDDYAALAIALRWLASGAAQALDDTGRM
ncbi:MAG: hypothetical protein P8Z81_02820 [Deinococcales bacterium]